MKKMSLLVVLGVMGLTLTACKDEGGATKGASAQKVTLKTDEDKTHYALGAMLGERLRDLNLKDNEFQAVFSGFQQSALKQKLQVNLADYRGKVQQLFTKKVKELASKNKEKGKMFLENFLKEKGSKKSDTGLAYRVLKSGNKTMPKETDTVEVHYHGTLTDGTVFDSSVERKKTVEFPLNRVIKGWTEGLQLVGEGGKIRLVIPPHLGYGDHGAPPKIPGGATLVFDVELKKVVKR